MAKNTRLHKNSNISPQWRQEWQWGSLFDILLQRWVPFSTFTLKNFKTLQLWTYKLPEIIAVHFTVDLKYWIEGWWDNGLVVFNRAKLCNRDTGHCQTIVAHNSLSISPLITIVWVNTTDHLPHSTNFFIFWNVEV